MAKTELRARETDTVTSVGGHWGLERSALHHLLWLADYGRSVRHGIDNQLSALIGVLTS